MPIPLSSIRLRNWIPEFPRFSASRNLAFSSKSGHVTALPDEELVRSTRVCLGRFGRDGAVLDRPVGHVRGLPAVESLAVKDRLETVVLRGEKRTGQGEQQKENRSWRDRGAFMASASTNRGDVGALSIANVPSPYQAKTQPSRLPAIPSLRPRPNRPRIAAERIGYVGVCECTRTLATNADTSDSPAGTEKGGMTLALILYYRRRPFIHDLIDRAFT